MFEENLSEIKPANPEVLGTEGVALIKSLPTIGSLFYCNQQEPWRGEPISLPSNLYKEEPFPSGLSLCGWRLTEDGIQIWNTL